MSIQSFKPVEPTLFARITQPLRAFYLDLPSGACIEFFDAEGRMVAMRDQSDNNTDLLLVSPELCLLATSH